MKIVNSSHEIWQRPGTDESDILRLIEKAGRVCYKSEDKITDGSAETFVGNIIKRNHGAVLEHASLMFRTDLDTFASVNRHIAYLEHYCGFKSYLRCTENMHEKYGIVSGNIRAWRYFVRSCLEWIGIVPLYMYSVIYNYPRLFPEYITSFDVEFAELPEYLIPITAADLQTAEEHFVHHDITMMFVCDRGVTHEVVRHRPASYAQESTRYCNYSNGKFGGEITVVKPSWCEAGTDAYAEWKASCESAETRYLWMTMHLGCTPQEARSVLPSSTKAELVMSATIGEWRHFFKLRTGSGAHPDMRALAIPALASAKNDSDIGEFFIDI